MLISFSYRGIPQLRARMKIPSDTLELPAGHVDIRGLHDPLAQYISMELDCNRRQWTHELLKALPS